MLIKNTKILVGKKIIFGDIVFSDKIDEIGVDLKESEAETFTGGYVVPGLVDIHTHGAVGEDFSDGNESGLYKLADYYALHGVTSFLATTMTLKEPVLAKAMHAIGSYKRTNGAKCRGVHLEGPFLSYAKRGAQAAENLHKPDVDMLKRLNEASGGAVRMVTVAPEEEGAIRFIAAASKLCTVSIGHTCADYDTAMAAFEAGATHATHLFNAMPPLLHRAPGVIGAAFDSGASVELICDGLHIHPSVIRTVFKLFGDKVNLISDSLRCAGMPDGNYELGGQPITMNGGKATLLDGTLAGSSISLMDAAVRCVKFGLSVEEAFYAASTAPALAIGIDAGKIEKGRAADLALLDDDLNIRAVFIDGKRVR